LAMDAERSAGRPLQTTAASPRRMCRGATGALLRTAATRRLAATVASCARRRCTFLRRTNHRGVSQLRKAMVQVQVQLPLPLPGAPPPAATRDQGGQCTAARLHRAWASRCALCHCLPRCLSPKAAGPESRTSPSTAASSTRPAPANASFHTPTCPHPHAQGNPPWRLR
jgi:hypothetical protein